MLFSSTAKYLYFNSNVNGKIFRRQGHKISECLHFIVLLKRVTPPSPRTSHLRAALPKNLLALSCTTSNSQVFPLFNNCPPKNLKTILLESQRKIQSQQVTQPATLQIGNIKAERPFTFLRWTLWFLYFPHTPKMLVLLMQVLCISPIRGQETDQGELQQ